MSHHQSGGDSSHSRDEPWQNYGTFCAKYEGAANNGFGEKHLEQTNQPKRC
jgi:hypothetical protein